jgi:hypothetical protein
MGSSMRRDPCQPTQNQHQGGVSITKSSPPARYRTDVVALWVLAPACGRDSLPLGASREMPPSPAQYPQRTATIFIDCVE